MKRLLVLTLVAAASAILVLAVVNLASRTPAQAAGTVGTGTPASCTEDTLRTALNGGGTVAFNCGGPATILTLHPFTITVDTVIQGGNSITITGGLATGLFYVNGASLTLNDITLDSAFRVGSDGGAILNNKALTLNNVTISNSQTDNNTCGGAIWTSGVVTISNSTFFKNTGGFGGGAICTGQTGTARVQISNSAFTSNQAVNPTFGFGGAILMQTGVLTMTDGVLLLNTAHLGGAIYLFQDTGGGAPLVTLNGVQVNGNSASDSGGAVYNAGGTLNVFSTSFSTNSTPMNTIGEGFGGAILDTGPMTIGGSTFDNNHGRWGGAVVVGEAFSGGPHNPIAIINHTAFRFNQAAESGGGLYANDISATVTVINSTFDTNSASAGGGIARFDARLDISDSSFTANQADFGGGLESAAVTSNPNVVSVTSVTFSGNKVTSNGGGFYNNGKAVLKNVTFKDNVTGFVNAVNGLMQLGNTVLDSPGPLPNCQLVGAPLTLDGHNLSTDSSCNVEQNNTPAQLGPLQINKTSYNQTEFHLPLAGSPLIDNAAGCPTLDQRGAIRPDACDIGAVEFGGLVPSLYIPSVFKNGAF